MTDPITGYDEHGKPVRTRCRVCGTTSSPAFFENGALCERCHDDEQACEACGCRHTHECGEHCCPHFPANLDICPQHGEQTIIESGSFIGFAGGRSYWVTLACGCTGLDESDDVAAAL